jgi:hypothetical protein
MIKDPINVGRIDGIMKGGERQSNVTTKVKAE